ncbi:MFS transporter [Micrococcus lylae]|uniref:MFS transporter n=1 Tax=Micrococcus lylae TaxID=1273 RepID=UPI003EBA5D8B
MTAPGTQAPAAARPPLWTRDFVLVSVGYLFVSMIFYLLMTSMALYAVERFGASDTVAGVVTGSFVLGAVVTRLVTPPSMEAWGRRRTMVVAMVLYVLSSAAYLVATSVPLLIAVRFVQGMCFGAGATVLATAVQSIIPPSRRSEGTGWFSTAMTVSSAIGPMTAILVISRFGYEWLFVTATLITLGALVCALALRRIPEPTPTGRFRLTRAGIFASEAAPIAVITAAAGMLYGGGVLAFLAGYARDHGIGATATSVFFLLFALGTLVGRFVLGPLQDRRGDDVLAYPVLIAYAVSFVLLSQWHTATGLLVCGFLFGLSHGPLISGFQTIAVQAVPPQKFGVATGTYFLLLDIATGLGPIIVGVVGAAIGLSSAYLVSGVVMALLTAYYWLVHGRHTASRAA